MYFISRVYFWLGFFENLKFNTREIRNEVNQFHEYVLSMKVEQKNTYKILRLINFVSFFLGFS